MIYSVKSKKISLETKRQGIHIILFVLAFLLKYLARWQMAGLLLLLLFFTVFLVPRLKLRAHLYRQVENYYSSGAVLYFLVLIVLVLIFPLPVVAAAWAILALGDGTATLVGKNFKVKELPWNRNKSYAGTAAFLFFGTIGCMILLNWMLPDLNFPFLLSLSLKTTVVAALVESLPWKINDNISVPIASALVMNLLFG